MSGNGSLMNNIYQGLMEKWRSRAKDRLIQLREAEAQIQELEDKNSFLVVEVQNIAADARIWEHRYKNLLSNKLSGCGEV